MPRQAVKRFDLETQMRLCALCPNMCRAQCPVAAVEKAETVTPRGRATLLLAIARGDEPLSAETAEVFYRCAACAACLEACPSHVDVPAFTAGIRARAAGEGVSPQATRTLAARLAKDRSLYGSAAELARRQSRYRSLLDARAKVLYFAGCTTAALRPTVIEATLRLFELAEVKVAMLRPEECCGAPLDLFGQADAAAAFASGLARMVSDGGFETIVSGCPLCTQVMKDRYPVLGSPLTARVKHVTEFLAELGQEGRLPSLERDASGSTTAGPGERPRFDPNKEDGMKGTYHDPCFLGRRQNVYDAPRRLLTQTAGVRLAEMERSRERAACCGGSPAVDVVAPRTAGAIGDKRMAEAERTGAGVLITACPRCLAMLGGGPTPTGTHGRGLTVADITEVLARRLGVWSGA